MEARSWIVTGKMHSVQGGKGVGAVCAQLETSWQASRLSPAGRVHCAQHIIGPLLFKYCQTLKGMPRMP